MRQLPKKGYYVSKLYPNYAIYSTGTAKANMYYQLDPHGPQWNHLLWTCLPGQKEIQNDFQYYPTLPAGYPPLTINSLSKANIKSFSY